MSKADRGNVRDKAAFTVERFDPIRHDATQFGCGEIELDAYIHGTFERDEADRTAVTYVLIDSAEPGPVRPVVGYFTLNSYAFPKRQGRRRDQDRNLGAYGQVPAFLSDVWRWIRRFTAVDSGVC